VDPRTNSTWFLFPRRDPRRILVAAARLHPSADQQPEARTASRRGEKFLFDPRNNAPLLFDTKTKILFYMSFIRVFLSYLTFSLVLLATTVSCLSKATTKDQNALC
jgi:hypothetical protein